MRQITAAAGVRAARAQRSAPAWPRALALAVLWACAALPAAAAPRAVPGGIEFTYTDPGAGAVTWAGEFNGWNATATPMTKGDGGVWSVVVALPPGEHQYKFVVDGQWFADPENPVTGGDFGNSVVVVGPDGRLTEMKATSNTPYSPKIFMGGRVIGLYLSSESAENNRFELRRPNMDIDLDFDIRMSDVLAARFLMNINSETENVEFFRSRLNFDRGHLLFTQPHLEIYGWDNESAGTWDDPLHLVGAVGIYDYGFGYDRQGFRVRPRWAGFETELLYADHFEPGGTAYPAVPAAGTVTLPVEPAGSGFRLVPGGTAGVKTTAQSDANEDVFAARIRREVVPGLRVGLLGRADRGYNLTSLLFVEATGDSSTTALGGNFEQSWFAAGGEAAWKAPYGIDVSIEYLRGTERLVAVNATRQDVAVTAIDSTGATLAFGATTPAGGEHLTTDDSNRFHLGGTWTAGHGDITLRGAVRYQDHGYKAFELDGIENSMIVWSAGWDRNWRYYLNREVKTTIDVEYHDFDYDARTPWRSQLWFPTGNFWLEGGEHEVSFDRMTLLGGTDALSWKPRLHVPVLRQRNVTFEYAGTFNGVALDKLPRYAESIFRIGVDVTHQIRFSTDSRWVKYDHPGLGLFGGYVSHFADFTYTFAPGIQVSLSAGVDPWVLDPVTNEYGEIGRDQFLFESGANGSRAETNYFSLGAFDGVPGFIDQAERALEKERRIQVEAIVRF